MKMVAVFGASDSNLIFRNLEAHASKAISASSRQKKLRNLSFHLSNYFYHFSLCFIRMVGDVQNYQSNGILWKYDGATHHLKIQLIFV